MTAGAKDAPKAETPKPLVEKVDEAKPVEEIRPQGRQQGGQGRARGAAGAA